jgi:hypothetical protein
MLSFLGAGLACSGEAESTRSVSGVSSHRMGLDAELSEPDRSGRVSSEGFSKVHCWSCEATAMSAIVSSACEVKESRGARVVGQDSGGLGNVIACDGATTAAA